MLRFHFISLSILFSFTTSAQDFITRDGDRLLLEGEEIRLSGMAFGNRVWVDDPLPDVHHDEESYAEFNELGMNAIRFYLNYITFEDDETPYEYKEEGWEWIDQNIEWAKKHDMYLILNMHVPQGGFQSQCEGQALWEEPENQDRLVALWKAIAERYADEPVIAGFDLVNEPIPTRSVTQWSDLAQRLIDSIRETEGASCIP